MRRIKSLFARHFFVYALVIIFGFAILGCTFIYQVNRYNREEKEATLNKTVERATSSVAFYMRNLNLVYEQYYSQVLADNLHSLAVDANGFIFVGNGEGRLLYVATEDGCYKQNRGEIPQAAISDLSEDGVYDVRSSNFYGWLSGLCYVKGALINSPDGQSAMVFVAVRPANLLYHDLSRTFLLITVVVLFAVLVVSIVVVRGLIKPLSMMAGVARSFARGDFSARVPLPDRQDELYDMTASFNSMADAMENTEMNRRNLMASVSHDLRTPMTTIGGFVDGILDGTIKPENQQRYLQIISDEIKRLSHMASSMVEVSRLESGERELIKSVFDISEIVRRIIISFEQKFNEKSIEVNLDIPDIFNINGDHDCLFQAVYNLVDNAVKFTDQGGTITVFIEEKSGVMRFHIINTGGEINPEDMRRIFDRFFKGDQSRNTSGSGSGLGLYIVKTVVNRHGGDIYVKSQGGKTEFVFTVPI